MQKKAARLCCAILLMAVAIAASMGLMSAVFAAQSLRTPDIQAAEAPTEAPLMLVRVLFCTDGEISEITIQDEAGQELQQSLPENFMRFTRPDNPAAASRGWGGAACAAPLLRSAAPVPGSR